MHSHMTEESETRSLRQTRRGLAVMCRTAELSIFMFVQFQSNQTQISCHFPHNIYIIPRNQGKVFWRTQNATMWRVEGEESITTHIHTHSINVCSEHMWHNKAPSEQKINFIFFDFLLGKRISKSRGGEKNGKIIAISSLCHSLESSGAGGGEKEKHFAF